jgi:hypothetical protein
MGARGEHPQPCGFPVGASPAGPTLSGHSYVEDLEAGSMGKELSASPEPG